VPDEMMADSVGLAFVAVQVMVLKVGKNVRS
jgi:hypothetical protein